MVDLDVKELCERAMQNLKAELASVKTLDELRVVELRYIGKKGIITQAQREHGKRMKMMERA